jgi:hypothetical protein
MESVFPPPPKKQLPDPKIPLLRKKYEFFVQEYVKTLNGEESCRKAGWKKPSFVFQRVLKIPIISNRITYLLSLVNQDLVWSAAKIIQQLEIESVKTTNKGYERIKALELLCKTKALLVDKVKHEGIPENKPDTIVVINQETKEMIDKLKSNNGLPPCSPQTSSQET